MILEEAIAHYYEIAAEVVDELNKVPLINPVTPQELEEAILYAEKRYFDQLS